MNTITQYDIDLQLNQNLKSMIIHGKHGLVLIKEFVNGLTINKFIHVTEVAGKKYETELNTLDLNLAIELTNKIENIIDDSSQITLITAIELFRKDHYPSIKEITIIYHEKMIKHLKPLLNYPIKKITPLELKTQILDKLINQKKYSVVNRIVSLIKRIIKYAALTFNNLTLYKLNLISNTIYNYKRKHFAAMVNVDTLEQLLHNIEYIFNTIATQRPHYLIHFILLSLTMLRPRELFTITTNSIDFNKQIILVNNTKTKKIFRLPMTKLIHNCIKYILRHNTQAKYLFDYKIDNNLIAKNPIAALQYALSKTDLYKKQTSHVFRTLAWTYLHFTNVDFNIAEACLQHSIGNSTIRAYLRSDFQEERRKAMKQYDQALNKILTSIYYDLKKDSKANQILHEIVYFQ